MKKYIIGIIIGILLKSFVFYTTTWGDFVEYTSWAVEQVVVFCEDNFSQKTS